MASFCPIVTSHGDSRSDVQHSRGVRAGRPTNDVIPIEDAARLVAGQAHRDALRNAGPHEVSRGRATQVVKEPAPTPGLPARGVPGLAQLLDALSGRTHEQGERNQRAGVDAERGAYASGT